MGKEYTLIYVSMGILVCRIHSLKLATWSGEGVDSFTPPQDCQVETNTEMFSLVYSLYLSLGNFDTREYRKEEFLMD